MYLCSSALISFIDWVFSLGHMSMDLSSVLAALSSPIVPWVTGTSIQVASPQGCGPGLESPEPSGPPNYPGQHLHAFKILLAYVLLTRVAGNSIANIGKLTKTRGIWCALPWTAFSEGQCVEASSTQQPPFFLRGKRTRISIRIPLTTLKEIDETIRCSTAEFAFNRVARGVFVSYCANWRLSVVEHNQHVEESLGGRSDCLWLKRQCNRLWLTTAVLRTRCYEIC